MENEMPENGREECKQAIYSNDYYDLVVDYIGGYPRVEPACSQRVNDKYEILYYARQGIPELNLQDYPYQGIPKCFGLTDQSALEVSGILRLQNPSGLDLNGQGVLMGFVDTGIDYTHPAFRNADGTTRIEAIWDQTVEDGDPPQGFAYGAQYLSEQIDQALESENPLEIVPSMDENGHGTFMAGVACGSSDVVNDFTGAVPLSTIAMVKCKQAKQYLREFYFIPENAECYQENDLMLGMAWLVDLAQRLEKPLVLCIGMGTSMGGHNGEEAITLLTDEYGRLYQNAIVVSAGNEANARHHYYRSGLEEGETDIMEISVGDGVPGFYMEFWAAIPEIYRVSVLSPTGERFVTAPSGVGGSFSYQFIFERTRLTIDYAIAGARLGGQLIYFRFQTPYPGIWTIEVTPVQVIRGSFHCWLPLTELLQGEVFFLRSNPDTTILAPGLSPIAVVAGGYETTSGGVYPDSGRGYGTVGTIKPDILAPGVNVFGPETTRGRFAGLPSSDQLGNLLYGTRTGTSVSAAITAGGVAQIFQWGIVENNLLFLNSTDLSNLLIRGAQRSRDRTYPNTAYGYGILDVFQALSTLRREM